MQPHPKPNTNPFSLQYSNRKLVKKAVKNQANNSHVVAGLTSELVTERCRFELKKKSDQCGFEGLKGQMLCLHLLLISLITAGNGPLQQKKNHHNHQVKLTHINKK